MRENSGRQLFWLALTMLVSLLLFLRPQLEYETSALYYARIVIRPVSGETQWYFGYSSEGLIYGEVWGGGIPL